MGVLEQGVWMGREGYHTRGIKKKKINQQQQQKKRRQERESMDRNFSRRPKPATAAIHTETVVWLEKGRGCMGQKGKGEGEGGLGI